MGNFFSNWEDVEIPDELEDKTAESVENAEGEEDPCKNLEGEELAKCQQESTDSNNIPESLQSEANTESPVPTTDANTETNTLAATDAATDAATNAATNAATETPEPVTQQPQQQGGASPQKRRRTRRKRGNARKQTRKP